MNTNNQSRPQQTAAQSNDSIPQVNLQTQRSLVYHNQTVQPQTLLEWGYFLIVLPFRFIFSSLVDLFQFFWSLFESNTNQAITDYNPIENINEYSRYFNETFGVNHPRFYQGSYSQALNEAKRNFKYLIVYLHDNNSEDCNKIARETLANDAVIDLCNNQTYLFWSCSINLPEGDKVFKALKAKRCPFIGIILLRRTKMTLALKIQGPIGPNDFLTQLTQLRSEFDGELATLRFEHEQRQETALLRQQQDAAYAECLKNDQERVRKEKEEQEAKRRQEEEDKRKLIEEQDLKQRLRNEFKSQPDASTPDSIKLSFKFPNGNRLERIFIKTEKIKNLYNFVFCQEDCPKNFCIFTNFPRREIECSHTSESLLIDCGINMSMILYVNDLDA